MIRRTDKAVRPLLEKCFPGRADEPDIRSLGGALQRLYDGTEDESVGACELEAAASLLVDLRAPYLLRYVFVRDFLAERTDYVEIGPRLETEGMRFPPGGSQDHRYEAIQTLLDGAGCALVDIGCGSGLYLSRLCSRYQSVIGYEQAPDLRRIAGLRLRKGGRFICDIRGRYEGQRLPLMADVLVTEVLEHMPKQIAGGLVRKVLLQRPRILVMSVPNRRFNRHYLGCGFRHDDHDWEPSVEEFERFLLASARGIGVDFEIQGVGGSVNGEYSCILAVARIR